MPFASTVTNTIPTLQEGELGEGATIVLSTTDYENGLLIGRFAQILSGTLSNMDGTATPLVAGVVLRGTNDLVEKPGEAASELPFYASEPNQNYVRQGLVTVKLSAASGTPAQFGQVYAVNQAANADNGYASTLDDDTTDAVNAEFIEPVVDGGNIWWVRLK